MQYIISYLRRSKTIKSLLVKILIDLLLAMNSWRVWGFIGFQDIKNSYKRSMFGSAWFFINLLVTSLGLGYVYGTLFHQNLRDFFIRILLSISLWNFISGTIIQGCHSFIISEGYIKQFSLLKQIYSLRVYVPLLFNLSLGFFVCILMAKIFSIPAFLPLLPLLYGLLLLFVVGLGHVLLMPYYGTRFRDLSPALGGMFQILFYVTPIIFTPEMLSSKGLGFVYEYNPLYYLMEIIRCPILLGTYADIHIYKYCLIYLVVIWFLYVLTVYKYDARVTYWL